MKIIQERAEGALIPQGLSVTRVGDYRAYCLRLGGFKMRFVVTSDKRRIFGVYTAIRDPEFPGQRMSRTWLELEVG